MLRGACGVSGRRRPKFVSPDSLPWATLPIASTPELPLTVIAITRL